MQDSILSKCAEGKLKEGYRYDSKVVLEIDLGKYMILAKILLKNVTFLHKLGLGPLIRDELVRDVRTVKTIFRESRKRGEKMMGPTEMVDSMFEAMMLGQVPYTIIRFPPTGRLMLDLRNGMLIGDLRDRGWDSCGEQKDES